MSKLFSTTKKKKCCLIRKCENLIKIFFLNHKPYEQKKNRKTFPELYIACEQQQMDNSINQELNTYLLLFQPNFPCFLFFFFCIT